MSYHSLKEAYTLAHTAECRLSMEASRPERNMRFLVGHLMHYENLRLRIVEIEHDISKREASSAVAFKGTGHVDRLQKKPSTGQLGRKSPPPPPSAQYDDDGDEEEDSDPYSGDSDGDDGADLGLTRFPSGAARPAPPQPPELIDDDEDDEDEPESPEEPDQATLESLLKTPGSKDMANVYEGVKKCPCHNKTDKPSFEQMWELPRKEGQSEGVTRAVAQVWA